MNSVVKLHFFRLEHDASNHFLIAKELIHYLALESFSGIDFPGKEAQVNHFDIIIVLFQ